MHKITEKDYRKWENKQKFEGIAYQLETVLSVMDMLVVEKIESKFTLGTACSALAYNCRFLYENFDIDMNTKYNWKELFEDELS